MNHHAGPPAAADIRLAAARQDLRAADGQDLGSAPRAQLVMLVERLRGSLDALLRICNCDGPGATRSDLVEAEEADLGQATREYLMSLAIRLRDRVDAMLRILEPVHP